LSVRNFEAKYATLKSSVFIACFIVWILGNITAINAQDIAVIGDDSAPVDTNLLVRSQVLIDSTGGPFAGAVVHLLEGTQRISTDTTDSIGYFTHHIPFDGLYKMVFIAPGFLRKSLEFDTRDMPDEDRKFGYDAGRFKVKMTQTKPGMPIGLLEEPIARFKYDSRYRIFAVDHKYRKERKEKFKNANQKDNDRIKF
jgi:hypothetical protein